MPSSRYDPFTFIIKDFAKTFRDHSLKSAKLDVRSYILFWTAPFIITLLAVYLDLPLSGNLVNILLISLSVFAALLFNILLLIYDLAHKIKAPQNGDQVQKIVRVLVNETFANISFSILISILSIVFLIIDTFQFQSFLIENTLKFLTFYLVIIFIMSLFIDLKRIYVLLQFEMNNQA